MSVAMSRARTVCLLCLFLVISAASAQASTLTLGWDPAASAAGYIVVYGTASGSYTGQVDVGNVTQASISGLAASTTYYFAVKSYGSTGLQSGLSAEVSGKTPSTTPPMTLTVSVQGAGTVTSADKFINCPSTCSHGYASGATVTLQATPLSGFMFAGWTNCSGGTVVMSATTSCSATFMPSAMTSAMFAADFNNDGVPDLLAQTSAGLVTLSTSSGATFSQPSSPYNDVISMWRIAGVGDFNKDGRPDIVWQNATGAVVVWLSNGSGTPSGLYLYAGDSAWRVVGVADVDRDGYADLIWQSPTGQVVVWFMQGTSIARAAYIYSGASDWHVVGVADFNGDGNADLLWQGPDGTAVVWIMQGTTQTSARFLSAGPSAWHILSAGDLDGDGKPDILWVGPSGQIVAWMLNGFTLTSAKYVNALVAGWQISTTP